MRDPHVKELRYKITPAECVEFRDPPEAVWEVPECRIVLTNGQAAVELIEHYATVDAARLVVERYLKAWEIKAALDDRFKCPPFRFKFAHHTLIDRDPDPAGGLSGEARGTATAAATLSLSVSYEAYPPPPSDFSVSSDVEIMWRRWEGYKAGIEPLPSMAYFCLTVVEARLILDAADSGEPIGHGEARRRAADRYGVDPEILKKLGNLVSEVGDEQTRRKAHSKDRAAWRPYTTEEAEWIEQTVIALIRRAGEWEFSSTRSCVRPGRSDFPQL